GDGTLPHACGLAPLLPRDRYAGGDDPARRDWRLRALPASPAAHGVSRPGPERALLRGPDATGKHHQGRQHPRAAPPGRSVLACPPRAAARGRVGPPEPGAAPRHPRPGLAGPAPASPAVPPPGRPREAPPGRRGGMRPRTGRLPLGRADPAGGGGPGGVTRHVEARTWSPILR